MSLAENIYRLRTEKNMSQLELAEALEVSRQSVSKWETGTAVPELDKLIRLSDLFGITLDELVGRSSPDPDSPQDVTPEHTLSSWIARLTPRMFMGSMFFFCAFLFHLYSRMENNVFIELMAVLPLVLCGIICLRCQKHSALWCAWILAFPYLLFPFRQFLRVDFAVTMILLFRIPLLIYSVLSFRKEKLELTNYRRRFLLIGWSACFLWFVVWLARLSTPPVLFEGFTLGYLVDVLMFPLFTALLTTSIQVRKHKEDVV